MYVIYVLLHIMIYTYTYFVRYEYLADYEMFGEMSMLRTLKLSIL